MFLWSELTNELAEAYPDSSRGLWRAGLWTVLVHMDNHSSHALECSFTYKKIPLQFLLSDTGFTGTPNPTAVQWQREGFVGENSSEWRNTAPASCFCHLRWRLASWKSKPGSSQLLLWVLHCSSSVQTGAEGRAGILSHFGYLGPTWPMRSKTPVWVLNWELDLWK